MKIPHIVYDALKKNECLAFNFFDAVEAGTICSSDIDNFMSYWAERSKSSGQDPNSLYYAAMGADGWGRFAFQGKIFTNVNPSAKLLTVVEAEYLLKNLGEESKKIASYQRLAKLVAQLESPISIEEKMDIEEKIFQIVEKTQESLGLTDDDGLLPIQLSETIKGKLAAPVLWVTNFKDPDCPSSEIWRSRKHWNARATVARRVLALEHLYSSNKRHRLLAALIFDKSQMPPDSTFFRPTPLDNAGARFKAAYEDFTLPAKQGSWGRTIDTLRMSGNRPHRGAKESVSRDFRPTTTASFTLLGMLRDPVDEENHYPHYVRSISRARDFNSIFKSV